MIDELQMQLDASSSETARLHEQLNLFESGLTFPPGSVEQLERSLREKAEVRANDEKTKREEMEVRLKAAETEWNQMSVQVCDR